MRALARVLLVVAAGAVVFAALGAAAGPFSSGVVGLVRVQSLVGSELRPLAVPSRVYSSDGKLLAVLQDADYRVPVKLSAVSTVARRAVLDVEDRGFYLHGALDLGSIVRAVVADVRSGKVLEGGSTITQQLVKSSILNDNRTLARKVKEAILAIQLEHVMSRDQIFQRYLNTVYFGNGAYGIEAAARTYFGVDARRLDAPQAALLAGMIENPALYDPLTHPRLAAERRDVALQQMVSDGDLSRAAAAAARRVQVPTRLNPPPVLASGSTFVEEVVHSLLQSPALGSTPAARYDALFRGGLRITTTLSSKMQADAKAAVRRVLPAGAAPFTSALVALDPRDGAVRALVSGNRSKVAGFDVVTGLGGGRGRQPGSSFKIFTLLAGLESGYSPYDTVDGSSPCSFYNPSYTPDPYVAHNAEPGYGVVTMTTATADSINCAYLRFGLHVGLPKIVAMARRLGITTIDHPAAPSLIIGSEGVYPIQMAAAYAALADDGVYHRPYFVSEVTSASGRVLLRGGAPGRRVVPAQDARVATQLFSDVVRYGTGTAAAIKGRPLAGKTGTTDQFKDAWFDGYTPQLVTSVWMGDLAGEVPMYDVGGTAVYGGTYPAEICGDFMSAALAGQPVIPFKAPDEALVPPGRYLGPVPYAGPIPYVARQHFVPAPSTIWRPVPATTSGGYPATTAPATTAPPATVPPTSAPQRQSRGGRG